MRPASKLKAAHASYGNPTADRLSGDPIELNSQLSKDSVQFKEIQLLSPAPLHGKDLGDPDEDVECVCVDADGVVDGVEFGDTVAPVGMVLSPVEDQMWSMNNSFEIPVLFNFGQSP